MLSSNNAFTFLFSPNSAYWSANGCVIPKSGGGVDDSNKTVALTRCVYDTWYWGDEQQEDRNHPVCMIPVTEHVFALPNTKYDIVRNDGYVFEPFTIPGPTGTLARNSTPEKLTWAGQNALNYDNLINSAVEAGIVSDAGSVYLRESDKDIRGRISYTINGKELERNCWWRMRKVRLAIH